MTDLPTLQIDGSESQLKEIKACVTDPKLGAVLLRGLPLSRDPLAVSGLCSALGTPAIDHVIRMDYGDQHVYVQAVEYDEGRIATRDGYLRNSAGADAFACHTDCASDPRPPDLLFLHCVKNDPQGGESILVRAADLLARLSPEDHVVLRQPIFPFGFGSVSILEDESGIPHLRYNRFEIDKACNKTGVKLSRVASEVLERFACEADKAAPRTIVLLQPGECLLLHNHRWLHGRYPFSRRSGRILLRARSFLPCDVS